MVQITFIFRMNKNPSIYYGKIILNNLSNHETVDFNIKNIIENVLNTYLTSIKMPRLRYPLAIGIMGSIQDEYENIEVEETNYIFNLYVLYDANDKNKCTYSCNNIHSGISRYQVPIELQLQANTLFETNLI
jgi:hypothetical protein